MLGKGNERGGTEDNRLALAKATAIDECAQSAYFGVSSKKKNTKPTK